MGVVVRPFAAILIIASTILYMLSANSVHAQQVAETKNSSIGGGFQYANIGHCNLTSLELTELGPDDDIEPCIIAEIFPEHNHHAGTLPNNRTATITLVQVTPAVCNNHRDGTVSGVEVLNSDNEGRGFVIGFNEDFFVKFRLVSVMAGNSYFLGKEEYARRHDAILRNLIETFDAQYIVGTCSIVSEIEKQPALDTKTILLASVGPPGFYKDKNPYVFGIHINSDEYPLPSVLKLSFYTANQGNHPSQQPVRVIYRTESEFFFGTCHSAIEELKAHGFTDLDEILYDHSADEDGDGVVNQFDEDFLRGLADQACPPGSGELDNYNPALFLCTLSEHNVILERWMENGCRPISLWLTSSTLTWAKNNRDVVPFFQGGTQWHPAFAYSDRYFNSGLDLLLHNQQKYGYPGTADQLGTYTIVVLFSQHIQSAYRVIDNPDPISDFADPKRYEVLRRDMVILNIDTLFGPVVFNEYQRNYGRGAAGTQWLPTGENGTFQNNLVSPLLQAEADTVIPAPSAIKCNPGYFINSTLAGAEASLLSSMCSYCPADTFTAHPNEQLQCSACPGASTTDGSIGQTMCELQNDNFIPMALLAFGYFAVGVTWTLALSFIGWVIKYRNDPVVCIAQTESLILICIGALVSSSSIIALSFQAGVDEDTSAATMGCRAAPFLYALGWMLEYASLSAKTLRLYKIVVNPSYRRVQVKAKEMYKVIAAAMLMDLVVLVVWATLSPLEYERHETSRNVDQDGGVMTIESVGECVVGDGTNIWVFVGPLIALHAVLVIGTNVLLYKVRKVGSRYREQKYVALASIFVFEVLLVGLPVLLAVRDSAEAKFIVFTSIVALNDSAILCLIFIPKIIFQHQGLEPGVQVGESILSSTHRAAANREWLRQSGVASGHISQQHASAPFKAIPPFGEGMSSKHSCNKHSSCDPTDTKMPDMVDDDDVERKGIPSVTNECTGNKFGEDEIERKEIDQIKVKTAMSMEKTEELGL